jgi:hypothetical protein
MAQKPPGPKTGGLIAMPKVQVTQDELEYATGLLNQMESLRSQLEAVAGVIFQKLENGCELANGPLKAEIREEIGAMMRTKRLFVNGREA